MSPAFIDTYAPSTFRAADCSNAVFIHNPVATRKAETPQAIASMQRACGEFGLELAIAETSPEVQGNIEMLQATADEKSLVIVRAGDGGLNKVLSAMRAAELQNPVLAQAGGRKNDVVKQLFGRAYRKHPDNALRDSVVSTIYPIELAISHADGSKEQFDAFGYASKGVTDDVARTAGSKEWREKQVGKGMRATFVAEGTMAIRSLLRAVPYQLAIAGEKPEEVIDFILGNGSSMAGNMDLGQNLFEPGFRKIIVKSKLGGWATTAATLVHIPVGKKVSSEDHLVFTAAGGTDHLQIDGDIVNLRGPATVRARVAPTGINMLTSPHKR
jgi:diacylglycerol kinase family enzyme